MSKKQPLSNCVHFSKKKCKRDKKFSITKFQLVNSERNFGIDGRIFFFKYLRFKLQFKF